jgi:hypothetical protein
MRERLLTLEQEVKLTRWYEARLALGTAATIAKQLGVRPMYVYDWMMQYRRRRAAEAKRKRAAR